MDARAEGRSGMYPALLEQLARPGKPRQVTVITVALVLACTVARRWRVASWLSSRCPGDSPDRIRPQTRCRPDPARRAEFSQRACHEPVCARGLTRGAAKNIRIWVRTGDRATLTRPRTGGSRAHPSAGGAYQA